ncbi:type II toxin-antitoxin system RelE/ParE family toxin [Caballeronia concitans]|uniref:Translation repressor RelE n=1 Tax=Caballeronia concitans TaxID=1777133 RepID=A0A658QW83_9BURK|nr:type II toxin-antitoxin system RelE/ParE family toxin [Caballeronia concitans]KIG03696.1 addiction module toxin, RelE/StbE family [Burkholderia sp. MR1]SAL27655.1 translation repressor RelE [Caballeronia concitans]
MTLQVLWTHEARSDIREIIRYIAEHSPEAARSLKERIEAAPSAAALNPELFRPGRIAGTREIVVHPNYIVVYRVTDAVLEIINVVHARQRYPFD